DLMMVNVPFDFMKTDAMIFEFFQTLDEKSGDIGILLYNSPHSGYLLPLELQDRIVNLPSVCCNKDGANHGLQKDIAARDRLGDRIRFTGGNVTNWPMYAEAGFTMIAPTTAAYMMQTLEWQPIRDLIESSLRGDLETTRRIHALLQPMLETWRIVYSPY